MSPTTRRSAKEATEAKNTNEDAPEEVISSRGKRKSTGNDDNENTTINPQNTPPKRQRLAVRTREDESTGSGRKTHLEVEIPISSNSKPKRSQKSAVSDSQGVEEDSDPEAEPSSASKQLEDEASQQLASQSVEPDATPAPKPKGKHVVFGDDDDVEKFVAAAAKTKTGDKEGEDQEDSDDDDAPEAVSTQTAAKQIQKAAQAASEAADKQAATLKRKRQEKDTLYKTQAAERRKRTRSAVEVHQTKPNSKPTADRGGSEDNTAEIEEAITSGRRRAHKFQLPTILPPEFLTDSSDEDEDEDKTALKKRKTIKPQSKKINFDTLGNEGKKPRDQIVGTTRYRVLAEQADPGLAPRRRRDAQRAKESLLKRRREGVVVNRRKGFFVK
ncbi:uncharacterized protein F4822DRAFT_432995 [Hypoxylon trugodes]|uniref:uncharacterized protein n=1 Tax=Hypoxylon trugodes TaxID=326681 RepID=UPI00219F0691|nr:uncharacterized protein F4822DRAFT_432995 [Hypoxylon trugodes]KAI1384448.1 hypothetical protein F4822DRAFT_432995 [Hypoxylon trugodes]